MGFWDGLAKLFGLFKREVKILVIGLDNSGKTTILDKLKPSNSQKKEILPTIGFNVDKIDTKQMTLTCFDMSGQRRYRNLWEHYYKECDAVIFVIDSSDKMRLVLAQDEIEQMLIHPHISNRKIPLLFYANKCDITESLSASVIAQTLFLDKIRDKPWNICSTNGLSGDGIQNGTVWLIDQLRQSAPKK